MSKKSDIAKKAAQLFEVEEFDKIDHDLNKEIPINNGGYYSFGGFYNNLEMDQSIKFGEGFKVDKDYTFYYTITGGPAPRPQSMN